MQKTKVVQTLYKILYAVYPLALISQPLGITVLGSISTAITFLCSFFLFAFSILRSREKTMSFVMIIVLFFLCVASMLASSSLSYQSFVHIAMFLELPFLLFSLSNEIEPSTVRFISAVYFIVSVFYVVISFSGRAHAYLTAYGYQNISPLTLGYHNPNETAMYLFCAVFGILSTASSMKRKPIRVVSYVLVGYLLYLSVLTESRAVFFAELALMCAFFFLRSKKPGAIINAAAIFIPVIFVLLLTMNTRFASNIVLGEAIDTGRSEIYYRAIRNVDFKSFFLGDFSHGFQNLHNAPLAIFAAIGILGLVVFYLYINRSFKAISGIKEKKSSWFGLWTINILLIYSSVEAALFTAGSAFSVGTFTAFLLAKYEVTNESIAD